MGRQRFLAGIALGVAIAAKLYPIVFAPVFVLWLLWRKEWKPAGALVLGLLVAVGICFIPFLIHSPEQLWSFVAYHSKRGLQIESGAAGLAMLLGNGTKTNFDYGAIHLEGPLASRYLPLLTYLFPLAWLGGIVRTLFRLRETADTTALLECSCGLLLLFMALNKVFSPQFMIWLIPFLPLLKPHWRLFGVPLFLATTIIFPLNYGQLMAGTYPMVLLLNLRNFGVLILGILLLWGGPKSYEERYTVEHA
ncbi:MAG: glycosyltransferase 87 family protein [Armatimonas sp.]